MVVTLLYVEILLGNDWISRHQNMSHIVRSDQEIDEGGRNLSWAELCNCSKMTSDGFYRLQGSTGARSLPIKNAARRRLFISLPNSDDEITPETVERTLII